MATHDVRLANQAWESLLRAQVVLAREFRDGDVFDEVPVRDYDVLYTLAKAPDGLRIAEINKAVMVTQPGMSKLVSRLEARGLVERRPDPGDARAVRIVLTPQGQETQRRVGLRHARQVAEAMTRALDADQLRSLHELCSRLVTDSHEKGPGSR